MLYYDRVFGDFEIKEPLILDLMNSPSMQRLKGVDQSGYFEYFYPGSAHSRFEHSMGVYFILNKFKAPLAEQAAGLIHDVSHSVFSHCLDYIGKKQDGAKQSRQDNIHSDFVLKSELPHIFSHHGIDVNYILDDANLPLKERELPDLCADRIDYSLRGGFHFGVISKDEANEFLNNLTVVNNFWVFLNQEWARKYADFFSSLNAKYYAGIDSGFMLQTMGSILKHSLDKQYINKVDLYTTDEVVLKKIKLHLPDDETLKKYFARVEKRVNYYNNPDDYELEVFCKARPIDPLYLEGDNIFRLSETDNDWKQIKLAFSEPARHFIKVED